MRVRVLSMVCGIGLVAMVALTGCGEDEVAPPDPPATLAAWSARANAVCAKANAADPVDARDPAVIFDTTIARARATVDALEAIPAPPRKAREAAQFVAALDESVEAMAGARDAFLTQDVQEINRTAAALTVPAQRIRRLGAELEVPACVGGAVTVGSSATMD